MSVTRSELIGDRTLPDTRNHGVDADISDFEGLSTREARKKLDDLSKAERVAVLFNYDPFDYQKSLIDATDGEDVTKVAIQPGRQVGKTLTGAVLAADHVATTQGEDTLICAPYQETADEMMRVATTLLETAEQRLQAMGNTGLSLGIETTNKREWEFSTNSRLLSRTLGVDGIGQRGKNPQFVICDEASYVSDSIFDDVIEPFFSTHDSFSYILTSTPAGDSGYFHSKSVLDQDWLSPYWPTGICPLVDVEWLAERRRKTDSLTWRQEYLGEFIGSSDRFFSPVLIDGQTEQGLSLTDQQVVALGADIARAGDDRTVIVGIDSGGVAEVLTSNSEMSLTDASGELSQLHERYSPASIVIDETGLGAGVVEMLEAEIDSRTVRGVKFTLDRKQSLFNNLKSSLENGEVTMAAHPRLSREMKQLEYSLTASGKTKLKHPDGSRDDHPDALALAVDGLTGGPGTDDYAHSSDNVVVL
jgi:hypothetical protein